MISILIPIFNYKIVDLVARLDAQLKLNSFPYEIICVDDGSNKDYREINKSIENFENVIYKITSKNKGRTQTRQELAKISKYNWLLFLDADVMPKSDNFVNKYIARLEGNYDVINGGIAYYDQRPESDFILRWKYGRQQEQRTATFRNKRPYKIITSGNFLIKKDLFIDINGKIEQNTYGLDNIFGAELKSKNVKIFHIDNEVYHLGLESNAAYLKKKEDSAITVLNHYKAQKISEHQNDLLHLFIKLDRLKLNYIFHFIYKAFGKTLRKNLLGKNPSIKLLQLYRISFMCNRSIQS